MNEKIGLRSAASGIFALNFGFACLILCVQSGQRYEYGSLVLFFGFGGLVLPVLLYDGDVEAEKKEAKCEKCGEVVGGDGGKKAG